MAVLELPRTDLHEWGNRERNTLVFNYTAACPLKCDFCCYGCSPTRKQKMQPEVAKDLILQIGNEPEFTSVAFTGGEPLLFPDEIIALAGIAKSTGKSSTVATAGHWADTAANAASIVDALIANGLNRLNVSFDPSHAAFVPRANIEHIIAAVRGHDVPLYVISTLYDKAAFDDVGDFTDADAGVFHFKKLVAKTGRAKPADVTYASSAHLDALGCYRSYYSDLVIFYDGMAYPCCSTFNRATPGIALGNVFDEGLTIILKRLMGNLVLRSIKRHSFGHLAGIIKRYDPTLAAEISAIDFDGGPCALCNRIFKNVDMTERINKVFARFEIDKIREMTDLLKVA